MLNQDRITASPCIEFVAPGVGVAFPAATFGNTSVRPGGCLELCPVRAGSLVAALSWDPGHTTSRFKKAGVSGYVGQYLESYQSGFWHTNYSNFRDKMGVTCWQLQRSGHKIIISGRCEHFIATPSHRVWTKIKSKINPSRIPSTLPSSSPQPFALFSPPTPRVELTFHLSLCSLLVIYSSAYLTTKRSPPWIALPVSSIVWAAPRTSPSLVSVWTMSARLWLWASRHKNRLMQRPLEFLASVWFLVRTSQRLFLPDLFRFPTDIVYLLLFIRSILLIENGLGMLPSHRLGILLR